MISVVCWVWMVQGSRVDGGWRKADVIVIVFSNTLVEFASELNDCLYVDEFASELNDYLSVDEFVSELNDCLSVCAN
jgi:hypothetical protein